jgi:hypothetical protein
MADGSGTGAEHSVNVVTVNTAPRRNGSKSWRKIFFEIP